MYLLICLVFPVIGLLMGTVSYVDAWGAPAAAGPGGGRRVETGSGGQRLMASPFLGSGRDDDEDPAELTGAASGGIMTLTR